MPYLPEPDHTFTLASPDWVQVYVHHWRPPGALIRGVFVWLHGMAEHALRYAHFAGKLAASGWHLYAPDLRGHGLTADGRLGVAGPDGWNGMVRDAAQLLAHIRAEHAALPVVLGGYSMGSIVCQRLMQLHGESLAGAVLVATGGGQKGPIEGLILAIQEEQIAGRDAPSGLMRWTFNEAYNAAFQPVRTHRDWLSRDPTEVDSYIADPLCGFIISAGLTADYISAQQMVLAEESYETIPRWLPVLLLNGSHDTSSSLEGFKLLLHRLVEIDMQQVSWRVYPEARHDLLHESIREQIIADVIAWLKDVSLSGR